MILEVGLGGRLDAVNAIDADCAVITSIDLDHMEYLGPDRETDRLREGRHHARRPAGGGQRPGAAGQRAAPCRRTSAPTCGCVGRDFNHGGDRQQWSWAAAARRYNALAYPALRGANQLLNAAGVLAAFEALRERLPISAQAVRSGLATVELPGRFQIVPGQPTLVLDVAHNPHAVATLALNLDQMGFYPRTHAVFGAMRDKDIAGMVSPHGAAGRPLAPDRPAAAARRAGRGAGRICCATQAARRSSRAGTAIALPMALRAALAAADPADRIVVFGSFLCVGGVLKDGVPRTRGAHSG